MRIEREIGDQPFQPAVLLFELPQAPQLADAQVGILPFPGRERDVTDAELSAEIADRGAAVGLAEGLDDLLLGELRPLHGSAPFVEDRRSR